MLMRPPDYRVRQRDYLLQIARALTQELDLDTLLKQILKLAADILAGSSGLIALRGEQGGWRIAVSHGIDQEFINLLDPLLAGIPDHQDPENFELRALNRFLQEIGRHASSGVLTGIGLPLEARRQVVGLIFIFRGSRIDFAPNEKMLLQSFADQAAIAVQNAQLFTQATQDKQRIDALLDSVADGILIMQPDHTIERVNPAFARMWGKSIDQIVGKKHEDVINWMKLEHGHSLAEAEAGGWPLAPQATVYVEGDIKRSDGSTLPVGVTYAPLLSMSGNLLNIIASARDISHFRAAEELKSTFISVVSHELKTPVALIKGYVSTLRREDAKWDRKVVDDSLAVIEEESDRLADMIENLLDATRLEAGAMALNSTDFSLKTLVERLAERFKTQTDKHIFEVDFPEEFPVILGDEARIAQVVTNLIGNAIKYSPHGGVICIDGRVQADNVMVCVCDQGPGIAHGDAPHVFDRFYRAQAAQKKTAGAGLGLYLARAVIEAHQGEIWVDPKHDEGARICFSLPRT